MSLPITGKYGEQDAHCQIFEQGSDVNIENQDDAFTAP
jgi:hypothetical protein